MPGLFKSEQVCVKCGAKMEAGARFCPQCGSPQTGGDEVKCPTCGKGVSPAAKFCPACGRQISLEAAVPLEYGHWKKAGDAFATRIDLEDLPGFLRKEFIIEPGTNALLLADGRAQGIVGPGKYTLQTLFERLGAALTLQSAKRVAAILIDAGNVELPFEIANAWTSDPLQVKVACRVVLRHDGLVEFLVNVLKGNGSYPLSEVRNLLYPEVAAVVQDWLGRHTAQELSSGLQTRAAIEQALEVSLDRSLTQYGLKFVQLRVVGVTCEPLEKWRGAREELLIAQYETDAEVDRRAAELAKRKRLFDVANVTEVQALAEEEAKLRVYQQRADVKAQLQQAVLSAKFDEVKNERDFEDRLRALDKQKVLSEKDWEELKRSIAWEREDLLTKRDWDTADRQAARSHALAKLELDRQYELKQAEWVQKTDLDKAQFEYQSEMERQRLDATLDLQRKRWLAALEQQEKDAAVRREQAKLDDVARREKDLQDAQTNNTIALQNARTQVEITKLQAEQDRIDGELGILLLEKMQMRRVRVEAEKQALDSKAKNEELERQIKLEEQRHRQEMDRLAAANAQELAVLAQKGKLTPEQLIAVSPVEQATLLKDLKQAEAAALAEQARAQAQQNTAHSAELTQLYERLITQAEQSGKAQAEAAQQTTRMVQETAHKALDSQREGMVEVARAVSQGQQPPTVIVAGAGPQVLGPQAASGSIGATTGPEVLVCPRCHAKSPIGTKFCQNCGHQFYEA